MWIRAGRRCIGEIRRALLDHLVLHFRDQELSPEALKALGRRFGALSIHPHYRPLPGHREILPVLKEPEATENIGGIWHSGAAGHGLKVPPWGGDTLFANQYLA